MTPSADCGTVRLMASLAQRPLPVVEAFDEKQFYLDEFRGHTLLFALPAEALARAADYEGLAAVVRALLTNDTRVLLVVSCADDDRGEPLLRRLQRRLGPLIFGDETMPLFPQRSARASAFSQLNPDAFAAPATATAALIGIWAALRRGPLCVGVIAGTSHTAATVFAQQLGSRLRVHKLILVEGEGGVTGGDGKPLSFMDETMLETLLATGQAEWAGLGARRGTFDAIRGALLGGVTSVNLCALPGVARELFTYEGSGTLFTLQDYCTVQRLGVDDYEEVERLIERGQREGLLKLRTPEEVAEMLVNGYGATIGAHHMAGVCALTTAPYEAQRAGEIVGLYTITRFKGEGIGTRLVARVLADARDAGLVYVFACTTEERAQGFFERQGFRRVEHDQVPAAKWTAYDAQRKAIVAVFRFDLPATAG
jgi:N-acetylglutamate synthase-like GNAT family acetyltransferase